MVSPLGWAGQPDLDTELVAAVDTAAIPLRPAGLDVQTCLYNGYSVTAGVGFIARAAAAKVADLVVMSTHSRQRGQLSALRLRECRRRGAPAGKVPLLLIPRRCRGEDRQAVRYASPSSMDRHSLKKHLSQSSESSVRSGPSSYW